MLRDPVSTSSLLLIAKAASNLQRFYVLRDAVRCDCDWPANPEWTSDFYEWLCCASSTIPNTEQAMSQMLQYNWRLLSPEEYHKVAVNVRQPVMYNRKHQNHWFDCFWNKLEQTYVTKCICWLQYLEIQFVIILVSRNEKDELVTWPKTEMYLCYKINDNVTFSAHKISQTRHYRFQHSEPTDANHDHSHLKCMKQPTPSPVY